MSVCPDSYRDVKDGDPEHAANNKECQGELVEPGILNEASFDGLRLTA